MANLPSKQSARALARKQTQALRSPARQQASTKIRSHIAKLLTPLIQRRKGLIVGSFAGTKLEPQLFPLHSLLPEASFCYPLSGEEGNMDFYLVSHPSELKEGRFSIPEPNPQIHQRIHPSEMDIILCPAWAYSKTFHRLGKGGGYYDRYLAKTPKLLAYGVHFENLFWDSLPLEGHDVPVCSCISESKIRTR